MIKEPSENGELQSLHFGGFIGFFIAVIAIFLFLPLFIKTAFVHFITQACFTVMLLVVISTLYNRIQIFVGGLVFVLLFIILEFMCIYENSLYLMTIAYSFYTLFVLMATIILAQHVLNKKKIDTNLIFGAITVYLLAGIFWSKLYFLLDFAVPNSFHGIESLNFNKDGVGEGYKNQFDFLYYSFSNITTLGLGDITPLLHLAKSLTILESMFGQLFVAIIISKLVSIWKNNHVKLL